ncbi:cbb3-type cytochrome oxidase assembly protein CcoS [Silvanigrella sp.]|jgi:cbb3-type cytochrome oxidase maturation protein|uniref:cbb3-type cytochrome oxidase assembly protein CcoS n=1 Tax=Silvanigrella sp. TaxID=2024976 RepID=UPI0037CA9CEE|nr:cbb3-type cytochrome oxidase assembly protein CcoS [Silvanigrellaceae bacterium]
MGVIIYLAIFMVFIGAFFLCIFLFAVKNGQFEDLETPAHKILLDDSVENNIEKNKEEIK